MSSLFQTHRRASRWLALLVLVTGWLVPLALPHAAGDDPICVPGLASEDVTDQIDVATTAQQPDHCIVCHTARSFRSALSGTARAAVWLTAGVLIDTPADSSRRGPIFGRLPARAPPVATTLV